MRHFRAFLSAFAACLCNIDYGISLAFTGTALETMRDNVEVDDIVQPLPPSSNLKVFSFGEGSTFAGLVNVGAFFGAFIAGFLSNILGRRGTLLLVGPIFVCAFVGLNLSSLPGLLFLFRIIMGIGSGLASVVGATYIIEIAPSHLRGTLGGFVQLAINVGFVLTYLFGLIFSTTINGVEYSSWRWLSLASGVPGLLSFIALLLSPESPKWLAEKKRFDAANKALLKLRGNLIDDPEDLKCISPEEGPTEGESDKLSFSDFKTYRLELVFIIELFVVFQACGLNAVTFYQNSLFQDANVSNANTISLAIQLVSLAISGGSIFILDRFSRRFFYLFGLSLMTIANIMFGFAFLYTDSLPSFVAVLASFLFFSGFSFGVASVTFLMMVEAVPVKMVGVSGSLGVSITWLGAFLVTTFLDDVVTATSAHAVFFGFSVISFCGVVYAYIWMPDTRGKSNDEIHTFFTGQKSPNISTNPIGNNLHNKDEEVANVAE